MNPQRRPSSQWCQQTVTSQLILLHTSQGAAKCQGLTGLTLMSDNWVTPSARSPLGCVVIHVQLEHASTFPHSFVVHRSEVEQAWRHLEPMLLVVFHFVLMRGCKRCNSTLKSVAMCSSREWTTVYICRFTLELYPNYSTNKKISLWQHKRL